MALNGAHIKIADQDEKGQGEIRVAGRHVMMGYLKNEQATKECIDEFGYFKTGDQGRLDKGGQGRCFCRNSFSDCKLSGKGPRRSHKKIWRRALH